MLRRPLERHPRADLERSQRLVRETVRDQSADPCLDVELRVHAEEDDLGAGPLRTFRSITLPLILPAVISAFLIAFTTSFDEYAVASFVVGTRTTFPIFLYSALRFPSQLPQVIAVAVVVIVLSLVIVVSAEVGRRVAERRLGALDG